MAPPLAVWFLIWPPHLGRKIIGDPPLISSAPPPTINNDWSLMNLTVWKLQTIICSSIKENLWITFWYPLRSTLDVADPSWRRLLIPCYLFVFRSQQRVRRTFRKTALKHMVQRNISLGTRKIRAIFQWLLTVAKWRQERRSVEWKTPELYITSRHSWRMLILPNVWMSLAY